MISGLVEDPFEGFSDLSEDDFNAITRATQFMGLDESNGFGNETALINPEIHVLREELHQARHRAEGLERSLLQLHQEKMTKEGEVAILRDRLQRIESEQQAVLMRQCERLKESEGSLRSLEEEYRRAVAGLRTEIAFKDQEIESLTGAMHGATLSDTKGFIPEGFEDFGAMRRKRPALPMLQEITRREATVETAPVPLFRSERELLDEAFACVEYDWDISRLMEYDYMAILKRKAELQKDLSAVANPLYMALERSYDRCLEAKREIVFRYVAKVAATCLALDDSQQLSLAIYSRTGSSMLLVKLCRYLSAPPFGTPPSLLRAHIDVLRMILGNATNAIPLEVKELLEASVLQRFLFNQINRDQILLAFIGLMEALSVDRNVVGLLLRQCAPPVGSSMLALVVKEGIERLQKDQTGSETTVVLRLIEFLCGLAKRNLVPLNVAFDRRLLSELVDWLHRRVLDQNDGDDDEDNSCIIECLYYVFVEKGSDVKANLGSRTFALLFIMQRLLPKHTPDNKWAALLSAAEKVVADWVAEREASRIDRGSFERISVSL
jgi:hypothetical protein